MVGFGGRGGGVDAAEAGGASRLSSEFVLFVPAVRRWPGLLGPAPRAGPYPRRSAGARRRGRGTRPRLAARTPALRPRPGRARAELYVRRLSRDPRCAARARPPEGLAAPPPADGGQRVSAGEARGDASAFPPASSPLGPAFPREPGGTCAPAGLASRSAESNTHGQCVFGPRPNRCRRLNLPYRVYRVTS